MIQKYFGLPDRQPILSRPLEEGKLMSILYGVNASPFVRKVRIVADEKRISYELVPIMPMFTPGEFDEISPLKKVPVWSNGKLAIADSSAICAMLDGLVKKPGFYPEDPEELGRALWFEEYADTAIAQVIAPRIFYNRVIKPKVMLRPSNEEVVLKAVNDDLPPICNYLESQLGDRDTLVGEQFSIADVAVGSVFLNLWHASVDVDKGRWPNLRRYTAAFRERPSVRVLIEEELRMFDGMPGLKDVNAA